ncbi:hypothetical protein KVD72_00845 [Helicobacter pylori]|nr:hypothetical protein KVD72_00845 [Helicobacter pylori]
MTAREKFEAEKKIKTEEIKTEREFYFKINTMRYDFAKQRYIAVVPILVAALGFIAFAIDKLNILPVLKTSAMTPCFRGLVAIIIGFFVVLFSFFKPKYSAAVGGLLVAVVVSGLIAFAIDKLNVVPILKTSITLSSGGLVAAIIGFFFFFKLRCGAVISILVAVAVVVVFGLIYVKSVAVIIIASFFCLYIVFAFFALCITYGCLLNLEKYFECQAETKDYEIRKLQSNTNEREGIERKRQECENNEKKARENYEEEKGKLSYCLLMVMISVILCVVFSVIYKINVLEHKSAKKMTSDQNSNMECFDLTIENPKPKDSKDDTKK